MTGAKNKKCKNLSLPQYKTKCWKKSVEFVMRDFFLSLLSFLCVYNKENWKVVHQGFKKKSQESNKCWWETWLLETDCQHRSAKLWIKRDDKNRSDQLLSVKYLVKSFGYVLSSCLHARSIHQRSKIEGIAISKRLKTNSIYFFFRSRATFTLFHTKTISRL